jgi:shikimate kinase
VAVVVGPPGAGKTTIGRLLAGRLGLSFRDVDADIVASAGKPISDIFTDDGEAVFRAMEEEAVAAALARERGVVALGGGAILSARTRESLAEYTVVFLNVGMAEGVKRTGMSAARPLLAGINPRATFKALLEQRLPLYREVATHELDTDGRTPEELAANAADLMSTVDASDSSARLPGREGERH